MTEMTIEKQLQQAGEATMLQACQLQVETQAQYESAAGFLKAIKERMAQVKAYWKQPKETARAAHKAICDREKAMLAPLESADNVTRGAMKQYLSIVEARRKAEQEALEEARRAETERLLESALEAETDGDCAASAMAMAMAEMVEDMPVATAGPAPSAEGTSIRTTWKARVVIPEEVPAYAWGMEIRKIDMSALNAIARQTKGTAKIDGVVFYQDKQIAVK